MKNVFKKARTLKIFSVFFAIIVWQICVDFAEVQFIVASPADVINRLFTIWSDEGFVSALSFSFIRITLGFFAAFVFGIILALIAGRFTWFEIFIQPYILVAKSVPVASFVIIALLLFSSQYLSVFISFLMAFPVIYTNVLSGIRSVDTKMIEMAQIFKLSWRRKFLYILLPSVKYQLFSACNVSIGLAWKSGIAAELIGIPTGSVGEKLYFTKLYYEMADLFAWTIIIVLISAVFEKLIVGMLRQAFNIWEKK